MQDVDTVTADSNSIEQAESSTHKLESANDASWPEDMPEAQRTVVVDDFLEVHWVSFGLAIHALRRRLRNFRDLNPDKHMVLFMLGHRAKTDGNPATRLFIQKVQVGTLVVSVKDLELQAELDVQVAEEEEDSPLHVHFLAGGVEVHRILYLGRDAGRDVDPNDSLWANWITHLRVATTAGVVYHQEGGMQPGKMEKKGRVWQWTTMNYSDFGKIVRRYWRYMGPEPEIDMGPLQGLCRRE